MVTSKRPRSSAIGWALKLSRPDTMLPSGKKKSLAAAIRQRKGQYEPTAQQLKRAVDSSSMPLRKNIRPKP